MAGRARRDRWASTPRGIPSAVEITIGMTLIWTWAMLISSNASRVNGSER